MAADDSISKVVYEDLVSLTFLCGRGLTLPVLMGRFLKAMAPRIPATALWLVEPGRVVARFGSGEPPPVSCAWRGLQPEIVADECLVVSVAPEVALVGRIATTGEGSARDVFALFARILALAWQAETVAVPGLRLDDYRAAKTTFQREWLTGLLERHEHNVSAAARASGLSRARLHQLVRAFGLNVGEADGSGAVV